MAAISRGRIRDAGIPWAGALALPGPAQRSQYGIPQARGTGPAVTVRELKQASWENGSWGSSGRPPCWIPPSCAGQPAIWACTCACSKGRPRPGHIRDSQLA